jgi:predicted ATP-grasp superfamily ATP-dependent carboligase
VSGGRVLIAGVSTRAAAESAARAGFDVTAIDAFGDLDQHPRVDARALWGAFTARAAVRAVADVECDAVAYLAPFENHLGAVRALATNRTLWGNSPDVLTRVRDPFVVANMLRARGFAAAKVAQDFLTAEALAKAVGPADGEWLLKPLASGGGHRIRRWRAGEAIPRGYYLQEFVDGAPGSVVFVAAGGRAVALAVLRQLIGDIAFGASGFQYCGNILDPSFEDAVADRAADLARAAADAFGLVGVNGIDFVVRGMIPAAVEVNPRWCASMELVERAYGFSVFGAHAAACMDGSLPEFDVARARHPVRTAFGKAIVFAREDVTALAVDSDHVGDVPRPRSRIRAGRPVCTVFAEATDADACYAALVQRAAHVYENLRVC